MKKFSAEKVDAPNNLNAKFSNAYSNRIPFTRTCVFWPFIDFLDTIGAPTERLLQQSGIPVELLHQPESLVPLHLAYAFLENAADAEGIEDFGSIVGRQGSSYELGVFGVHLREALTVYEYIQIAIRMIESLTSGQKYWLSCEGSRVRLHQYLPGSSESGFKHADRYSISVTLNMLRHFSDNQWYPEDIHLHTASKLKGGDNSGYWDARFTEGQTHSSLSIPSDLLAQAIPLPATAAPFDAKHADNSQPAMPDDLVNAVKEIITLLLPQGCPGIQLAAEVAGMSTRTFQRRLRILGTNYSELVQRTRMQLATQELLHTTTPVNELAISLGYRDPANFTRAFRCKTGISPQNFRMQVQNTSSQR